jgi:hypothetical protein
MFASPGMFASQCAPGTHVRFGSKADMNGCQRHVC